MKKHKRSINFIMRPPKSFLPHSIAIILALSAAVFCQDEPKAFLVDGFGVLNCGDILARTDHYGDEIKRNPEATGVILINPHKGRPGPAQSRRVLISSTLQLRGIDPDRYVFYLGNAEDISTEYWILPTGADLPSLEAEQWNVPPFDTSRPNVFGYSDEIEICPTFVPHVFAKLILDNPGSRGHIVIETGPNSMLGKWTFAEQWVDTLVEKHGIPRDRLKLFFTKGKDRTFAEFWFVPAKK